MKLTTKSALTYVRATNLLISVVAALMVLGAVAGGLAATTMWSRICTWAGVIVIIASTHIRIAALTFFYARAKRREMVLYTIGIAALLLLAIATPWLF